MTDRLSAPLTIVHLMATDRPVGPGKQIIHQSLHLPALGITPVIVSFAVGPGEIELLVTAAHHKLAGERLECSFAGDARAVVRLLRLLHRRSARALVAHGYKADLVGLMAARLAKIPVVSFQRGWTGENRRIRVYEHLDRLLLKFVDMVVAVSEAKREQLISLGLSPSRVVTIPNAVDVSEASRARATARQRLECEFCLSREADIVATAGRLSREKAQSDFLRACRRVARNHGRACFLIFGDGAERERLETLARDLGLSGHVVFCGYRSDFVELLPGIDVLVLSSLTEGLPNVVLEAFAAGVPVVATAVGGVSELAQHSVTALLAPPADPERLARAILVTLANRPAAARRAAAARELVAERYSFPGNARQFADLLRRVVDSTGAPETDSGEVG